MSKDDRLVTPPANARGIYIPQEYIAICTDTKTRTIPSGERKGEKREVVEHNLAAAAILRMFERWTHWKIRESHNRLLPEAVWVYLTQQQLEDFELVGAFGSRQLTTGFDILLKKGFLSRRTNPKVPFDRTYQYRFEKKAVQDALDELSAFLTIDAWKIEHSKLEQPDPNTATMNPEQAIPQGPSQVPTQGEKDLPADSTPDAPPAYAVGQPVIYTASGEYGIVRGTGVDREGRAVFGIEWATGDNSTEYATSLTPATVRPAPDAPRYAVGDIVAYTRTGDVGEVVEVQPATPTAPAVYLVRYSWQAPRTAAESELVRVSPAPADPPAPAAPACPKCGRTQLYDPIVGWYCHCSGFGERPDDPAPDPVPGGEPPEGGGAPEAKATPKKARRAGSTKPAKPAYWGDLVAAVIREFKEPNGPAAKIAEQLAGVAYKGERAACNCAPPATPEDVALFVRHYRKEYPDLDLPTSAESLARHWHKYNEFKAAQTRAAAGPLITGNFKAPDPNDFIRLGASA